MLVPPFCNPFSDGRENPAAAFLCPFPAGQGAAPLQSPFYVRGVEMIVRDASPPRLRAESFVGMVPCTLSKKRLRGCGASCAF